MFIKVAMSSDIWSHLYQHQINGLNLTGNSDESCSARIPDSSTYTTRPRDLHSFTNQYKPSNRFSPYNILPSLHTLSRYRNYHYPCGTFSPFNFPSHSYTINSSHGFVSPKYQSDTLRRDFNSVPYSTFQTSNSEIKGNENSTNQDLHIDNTDIANINDVVGSIADKNTELKTSREDIVSNNAENSIIEERNLDLRGYMTNTRYSDNFQGSDSDPLLQNSSEGQAIISNAETTATCVNTNATQNISEANPSAKPSEKEWNNMIAKTVKYVASADHSELLWRVKLEDRNKMIVENYKTYIREFSMTLFKKTSMKTLDKLKLMQCEYENILKLLIGSETWNLPQRNGMLANILSDNKTNLLNCESLIDTKETQIPLDLIIWNMNIILQNFFNKEKTPISQTESSFLNLTYSAHELEHMFADAIKLIEKCDTEITEVYKICCAFVDYEKKLFGDMSKHEIVASLKIPTIAETFSKLKRCMELNKVYEISVFIELHTKDPIRFLKQHYLVSTVFLLNALLIYLNEIDYRELYVHSDKKNYMHKRSEMSKKAFYIGQLFERLQRNIEGNDLKADFYGVLNCFRYHFKANTRQGNRNTLLLVQIPTLIAMVVDKSFCFTEKHFKELASFILYSIKNKDCGCSEFYNDKFEYFLEKNLSSFGSIYKHVKSFVKDYKGVARRNSKIIKMSWAFQNILKNLSVECEKQLNKNIQLKRLYILQLYWISTFQYKCLAFYANHDNFCMMVSNIHRRIELYYD
ncbi:hypothetical protein LUQ84_003278 [Hamiltosporidium tvaerminnensis]|nr:hypothetical protein LUQ84_003278 [Hamiltosporidium tvaerminnensis]